MNDEDRTIKYCIIEAIATQREPTIYDIRNEVDHHLRYDSSIDVDSISNARLLNELEELESKGLVRMPGDGYEMSEKTPYGVTSQGIDIYKLHRERVTTPK